MTWTDVLIFVLATPWVALAVGIGWVVKRLGEYGRDE